MKEHLHEGENNGGGRASLGKRPKMYFRLCSISGLDSMCAQQTSAFFFFHSVLAAVGLNPPDVYRSTQSDKYQDVKVIKMSVSVEKPKPATTSRPACL